MKPTAFEYFAPRTVEEVVAALAGGDTRVLAGGQSLVLEMNYRTVRPARLVDINRVAEFTGLDAGDGVLRVRPLVRHRAFERDISAGPLGRLLSSVVHNIAHPPIRARGTMLGSLAYAHPAAEWPAVATALDAQLDLTGPDGTRTVAAEAFFAGPFDTVRRPEELLSEARLPLLPDRAGVGFVEHRRTHASFAQLAAIAALTVRDGVIDWVRLGLVNAAERPVRAHAAERALLGQPADAGTLTGAARVAGEQDADPREQPHASAGYQRHAVGVLVRRALEAAVRDAGAVGDGR
ncbi:FAD binding domain-containing protein [Rugosimonospora africana]|uniref:Carbon monoxide dehydrogenase n=1 Tax=Rugosimonospora africana TaxID=556532 RepID=A0A8J3VTM7_9ACTN|nr:FAD binding domain-containing protein [Rugosimonospora africana]GIH17683.1 carbon monoxide dehydrogenase [Rugosimonospora africana]